MNPMISKDRADNAAAICMTLAQMAYAGARRIPALLADNSLATAGHWQLGWLAEDAGNLAFVAVDPGSGQRVVSIRGSVTNVTTNAFWLNWFEQDLNAFEMREWPFTGGPPRARLAHGTLLGLKSLIALRDANGVSLEEHLATHLDEHSPLTAVVGHSLGGALASAIVPYLAMRMPTLELWPCTFAGPPAGNSVFANWQAEQFDASSGRYFIDLDIVPHAWWKLAWIAQSYHGHQGPTLPRAFADSLKVVEIALKVLGDEYAQPGEGQVLTSKLLNKGDWFMEAGHQHSGETYLQLLGAPPMGGP